MQAFNHEIATKLREIAQLLRAQQANPFRVNAYLHAADTLDNLGRNVAELMQAKGIKGLVALPGIGEGIAHSIYEYVATGRMSRLENLRGAADPVELFRSIPTVGKVLAERIHDQLHVDSLEALENAVRDGQLHNVEGLGRKRIEAIEAWLQKHLDEQRRQFRPVARASDVPPVELILRVDNEYRQKASAGKLPRITPKRFNPENKAWLPILHRPSPRRTAHRGHRNAWQPAGLASGARARNGMPAALRNSGEREIIGSGLWFLILRLQKFITNSKLKT